MKLTCCFDWLNIQHKHRATLMGYLVAMECHLWLTLAHPLDHEKVPLLNAPLTPSGLIGATVGEKGGRSLKQRAKIRRRWVTSSPIAMPPNASLKFSHQRHNRSSTMWPLCNHPGVPCDKASCASAASPAEARSRSRRWCADKRSRLHVDSSTVKITCGQSLSLVG